MSEGLISFERRVLQCFEALAVQHQRAAAAEHQRFSGFCESILKDAVRAQQVAAYHAAVARRYVLAILQMQEEGYEK